MWVSFGGMIAIELSKRSPGLIFATATALTTGFPLSVATLGSGGSMFSAPTLGSMIIFVTLFNIVFMLVRIPSPYRAISLNLFVVHLNFRENRYLKYMLVLFFLSFFLFVAGAGFSFNELKNRTWRDGGDFDFYVTYMANVSFGIILIMFILRRRVYAIMCLLIVFILVFFDRSRSLLIPAVVPLVLYLLIIFIYKGRKIRRISTIIIFGFAIILIHGVVQQIRYLGSLSNIVNIDVSSLIIESIDKMMRMEGELGLFRYALWSFEDVERIQGAGQFHTFIRMLSFWLPSGFKPIDTTHAIAAANGAIAGASYHPTVYGIAYVDGGGFLGVYYALLLGIIFIFIDSIINRYRRKQYLVPLFLLAPACTFASLTARGTMSNAWVILCVCPVIIIGIWNFSIFNIGNSIKYRIDKLP